MSDWARTTIGDVITFQRGFDITRNEQVATGAIPVISSGGISSYHDTSAASGPGVIIGRKGTLGTVYYVTTEYWPHDTTLWVKDFKGNVPKFVYYFMKNLDVTFLDGGSANPTLNRNHLHPLAILWPPTRDQTAIAEVLGGLDDKIAGNVSLMSTAADLAHSILAEPVAMTPLGEVADQARRTVQPESLGDRKVRHFSLPAFDDGQIPEHVPASTIKSNKFAVDAPCVLVSKLNPRFPRVWDLSELPADAAMASTEFVVLTSRFSPPAILWAILSRPEFSKALERKVAGTSGSHQRVRPADLLATDVVDPRGLTEHTAEAITNIASAIRAARAESQTLAATRDALLPALMSGKLRVRDAEKAVGGLV